MCALLLQNLDCVVMNDYVWLNTDMSEFLYIENFKTIPVILMISLRYIIKHFALIYCPNVLEMNQILTVITVLS